MLIVSFLIKSSKNNFPSTTNPKEILVLHIFSILNLLD